MSIATHFIALAEAYDRAFQAEAKASEAAEQLREVEAKVFETTAKI